MYAVIKTGGKQERVAEGQTLRVELLGEAPGAEVTFDPGPGGGRRDRAGHPGPAGRHVGDRHGGR